MDTPLTFTDFPTIHKDPRKCQIRLMFPRDVTLHSTVQQIVVQKCQIIYIGVFLTTLLF